MWKAGVGAARRDVTWLLAIAVLVVLVPGLDAGPARAKSAQLRFEPSRIRRADAACDLGPAASCAHVDLEGLRVAGAPAAAAALQRELDRALSGEEGAGQSPQRAADAFVEEFDASRGRATARSRPWFLERTVRVLSRWQRLISLEIRTRRYTGGAHPSADMRFLNLDPQTGAAVGLDDLLVPAGIARLRGIVARALRDRAARFAVTSGARGTLGETPLRLPESVGVAVDGLVLAYDAYEVGPYAGGPAIFHVRFAELRSFLRPRCAGRGRAE